ncbi:MAG TPA: M14 family zinc carboxypeptidase [Candidatus Angelobacter sp.]|nr:M14 family zinc carboxypeptidase [Candidatus Angelobacter sp.]
MKKYCLVFVLTVGFAASCAGQIDFTQFHHPATLQNDMQNLISTHPLLATGFTIGNSVNGLPIQGIKISLNPGVDDPAKGDLIFVGLHHAREWLAAEMPLYLAEYLLTHYATDPGLQTCMNHVQIWIIPVLNPDGYAFTQTPANRYWRKNRRNNGDGTFGVDLNRNYSYQWGLGSGAGGSHNTFDDTYIGPSSFSEPETVALRDFIQTRHNPRGLVSYHTFSELFLRPWSFTLSDPPGAPTLQYIQQDSIARMTAVHGTLYSPNLPYFSFGEATDYFWNGMRLAGFTPEMRPSPANGLNGFSPDPSQIIPNNEENLPAALALVHDAGCTYLWIGDYAGDIGTEPSAVWLGDHWSHEFWVSPDISTVPGTLVGGSTVTLNITVHNDGPGPQFNAIVRAYYTDPRISLEFPNPAAVLIGEQTVPFLHPGSTTVSFPWTVPMGTNSWGEYHWCVGAIVMHPDDRPLTTQIQLSSNIGGRNFQTVPVIAGLQNLFVAVTNYFNVPVEYEMNIDKTALPRGWNLLAPRLQTQRKPNRKAMLLGVTGMVLEPGETIIQPLQLSVPKSARTGMRTVIKVNGVLKPLVAGKRVPSGNGYTFDVRVK